MELTSLSSNVLKGNTPHVGLMGLLLGTKFRSCPGETEALWDINLCLIWNRISIYRKAEKRCHGYFGIGYRFTSYIWQKYAFIKQVIKDFN